MDNFNVVFVPIGVPTFDLDVANDQFNESIKLLNELCENLIHPNNILLTTNEEKKYLSNNNHPSAVIIQNTTFANAAYTYEILNEYDCPILLWTLKEPIVDGQRLRLNSLTGAYSAANAMHMVGRGNFEYVYGSPTEKQTSESINAFILAAKVKQKLKTSSVAIVGTTPQGFDFGSAYESELLKNFGVKAIKVETRELINNANAYLDSVGEENMNVACTNMVGLEKMGKDQLLKHTKLFMAYMKFIKDNDISFVASRCWPDFFTEYGAPVCAVISALNDMGVSTSCEADVYGSLSMYIGFLLTDTPCFFGDPVLLNDTESSITYWHCGAAAPKLASEKYGANFGVHPNRQIGPTMDFSCKGSDNATIFRIGRKPDGKFRIFIETGEVLEKEKQFSGTSIVVKTHNSAKDIINKSVLSGFEPHFVISHENIKAELIILANMLNIEVYE